MAWETKARRCWEKLGPTYWCHSTVTQEILGTQRKLPPMSTGSMDEVLGQSRVRCISYQSRNTAWLSYLLLEQHSTSWKLTHRFCLQVLDSVRGAPLGVSISDYTPILELRKTSELWALGFMAICCYPRRPEAGKTSDSFSPFFISQFLFRTSSRQNPTEILQ